MERTNKQVTVFVLLLLLYMSLYILVLGLLEKYLGINESDLMLSIHTITLSLYVLWCALKKHVMKEGIFLGIIFFGPPALLAQIAFITKNKQ